MSQENAERVPEEIQTPEENVEKKRAMNKDGTIFEYTTTEELMQHNAEMNDRDSR
jgi:hypothetical protein